MLQPRRYVSLLPLEPTLKLKAMRKHRSAQCCRSRVNRRRGIRTPNGIDGVFWSNVSPSIISIKRSTIVFWRTPTFVCQWTFCRSTRRACAECTSSRVPRSLKRAPLLKKVAIGESQARMCGKLQFESILVL